MMLTHITRALCLPLSEQYDTKDRAKQVQPLETNLGMRQSHFLARYLLSVCEPRQ